NGIQTTEGVDRGLDDALCTFSIGHVVKVGDSLTACCADLGYNLISRTLLRIVTMGADAQIVDNNLRALGRQSQCIGASKPAACAGHNDYPTLTNASHTCSSEFRMLFDGP